MSLPEELVREVEVAQQRLGAATRSALFERALRLLLRDERDRQIEESLDAYYAKRSAGEIAEEDTMVRAFQRSQRRLDLDEEGSDPDEPRPK